MNGPYFLLVRASMSYYNIWLPFEVTKIINAVSYVLIHVNSSKEFLCAKYQNLQVELNLMYSTKPITYSNIEKI